MSFVISFISYTAKSSFDTNHLLQSSACYIACCKLRASLVLTLCDTMSHTKMVRKEFMIGFVLRACSVILRSIFWRRIDPSVTLAAGDSFWCPPLIHPSALLNCIYDWEPESLWESVTVITYCDCLRLVCHLHEFAKRVISLPPAQFSRLILAPPRSTLK